MTIKALDVVCLKDGRIGTILDVCEQDRVFLVEIADEQGKTTDMPTVTAEDIECVTWSNR